MAAAAVHPSEQTLQSYGLGKLDDLLSEAVAKHLAECDSCRTRVAELTSDTFLGRLQDARARPASIPPVGSSLPGMSKLDGDSRTPPPPSASTLPPGLAEHHDYEILRELGRGGMGVVYLARNKLMGRNEVLKVVGGHLLERPGVAERFLREIRSAAMLHHTNIVTAYSVLRVGQSLVFAMEYVEGFDLAQLVKGRGPLRVDQACNFIHQAALGLQYASAKGMVHRDIKPSNLILAREGKKPVVKVLDFGLSKVTSEGQVEGDGGLTREGQMLGTPDYIAPEQIRDAQSADIRADIYSLGCTLYCLLACRPPFRGDNLWDLYQAHFSMNASPLNLLRPEVPAELAALVAKMMAKEPKRRFQIPGEVAEALKPFFKPAASRPSASSAEISQINPPAAPIQTPVVSPMPAQPATPATAPSPPVRKSSKTGAEGVAWESLIEIKEDEELPQVVKPKLAEPKPVPAEGPIRRPPWVWPAVAALALLLGLFAVLGIVLWVKTSNGIIELVNLPKDAEVLVDGAEVSVAWPEGGKPAVISVTAGEHRIKVKKDALETSGDVVTVQAGGKVPFTIRLLPLAGTRPKTEDIDNRRDRSVDRRDDRAESGPEPGVSEAQSASNGDGPALLKAPFDSAAAKRVQLAWADHLKTQVVTDNPIGMKLVLIPAGEFMMGMTPAAISDLRKLAEKRNDAERFEYRFSAASEHRVTLTKPWFIGMTEVTVGQFRRFVEATGYVSEAEKYGFGDSSKTAIDATVSERMRTQSWRVPGYAVTDNSPVTQVTWNDAVAFCNWLSGQENLSPCYQKGIAGSWFPTTAGEGYRLPTEAEWEYACQAGATSEPTLSDGLAWLNEHAWFDENQNGGARQVAMKRPNAFGLFDTRGNVFEWCQDWFGHDYYLNSPPVDPLGPPTSDARVQRGGGWSYTPVECHSGFRTYASPLGRSDHRGFRVVRVTTRASTIDVSRRTTVMTERVKLVQASGPGQDGFVQLFNGRDLTGWAPYGERRELSTAEGGQIWTVRDGVLHGSGGPSLLFSPRGDYLNFRVRAQVKINDGGNSGLYFRTAKGPGFARGYEAQINSTGRDPNRTGSLYRPPQPPIGVASSHIPPDTWFTLEVEAIGRHIRVWVDHAVTVDWVDPQETHLQGHFAIQVHDPQTHIQVRNLEVIELDVTGKPIAGREAPTPARQAEETGKPNDATLGAKPPPGAVFLLGEKGLEGWVKADGKTPADWPYADGILTVGRRDIMTEKTFGDFALHLEFNVPYMPEARGQARGNSGVFLTGNHELQVLDSYGLKCQNNECGAIYRQVAPAVNACKPPLHWQTYDVTFHKAKIEDGKVTRKARVTVLQNGVKIIDDAEIVPTPGGIPVSEGKDGPLLLQDHGNAVRYRNIWIKPIDSALMGG